MLDLIISVEVTLGSKTLLQYGHVIAHTCLRIKYIKAIISSTRHLFLFRRIGARQNYTNTFKFRDQLSMILLVNAIDTKAETPNNHFKYCSTAYRIVSRSIAADIQKIMTHHGNLLSLSFLVPYR
jgi:hypothetical protein